MLSTSQGARAQPLMMAITTAGYDRHSMLWELYSHAKNVLEDPRLDPTFLPIVYEASAEADWTDEKVWKKANPALGDFRSLEEMRIMARPGQGNSGAGEHVPAALPQPVDGAGGPVDPGRGVGCLPDVTSGP